MTVVTIHPLKTHWKFWDRVYERTKKAEIRKNDRDYQVGDWLRLYRVIQGIPGSSLFVQVTDIVQHIDFPEAIQPGYVMLSFHYPQEPEQKYMRWVFELQGQQAPEREVGNDST